MAELDGPKLDGPRIEPRSGNAKQLVVFLHGYGADGNDLIEIGRAWQGLLPEAAFVSPHAPRPCGQAPVAFLERGQVLIQRPGQAQDPVQFGHGGHPGRRRQCRVWPADPHPAAPLGTGGLGPAGPFRSTRSYTH